ESIANDPSYRRAPGPHRRVRARDAEFGPVPRRDMRDTRGHRQLGRAVRVEVTVLEAALAAVERLVGVAPGIVGRVRSPVGSGHRDPGGQRTPATIDDLHAQSAHGPVVAAPGGENPLPPSPR